MQILKYVIILLAACFSVYTDCRYYKIKNSITIPTAIAGFLLSFFDSKILWWESLIGFIFPFVICILIYAARMLKAGDIKLFMAIGAVMGYKWIINCMAASMLAGGVLALILIIKRKCFVKRMKKLFNYFKSFILSGVFVSYDEGEKDNEGKFPFAVSILAGIVITIVLEVREVYLFIGK